MTKIDIISGFLGAGKTTLIKKLLKEAIDGEKTILIENEFGEIGVDGDFLKDAGIQIREMNSGCICCTLVGDFRKALTEVLETYHPERIIIEPSGVGGLSDIINAIHVLDGHDDVQLNTATAVVDATKVKMYMKNFGEFYKDQVQNAGTIILSRTATIKPEKLEQAVSMLRKINATAPIITTDWDQLDGTRILETMEGNGIDLLAEMVEEEHHHHDHDHEDECGCGCGCEDHDHDHEGHDHHHHHDHDDEDKCSCGCEDHEGHHHHHHADDVFASVGIETTKVFTQEELEQAMDELEFGKVYGMVLRAKGLVASPVANEWLYFDYVPGELEIRKGQPDITGKVCVIGSNINEDEIKKLFK
ncbi:putative metal chaperone, involved in Zn homeostasis, GTPase of COG0523 family [Lachnospiraceae bacterium TWA4]|nr:putative metal chaperone, involved in Zn homeostasis, GTPase of COG0523 family [Lachnospiraceae bacterium TWA4]